MSIQRFTQLFQAIDSTTSLNAKVSALRHYFRDADPADAAWALYLLLGKTRKRLVTSKVLRDTFLQITAIPDWLFEDCYAQTGDTAEVIALLLRDIDLSVECRALNDTNSVLSTGDGGQMLSTPCQSLCQWMEEVIPRVRAVQSDSDRQALIVSWWAVLNGDEVFVLNKLLTGAFRMGAAEKLVIRALAEEFGIAEAVMAHRLMGDVSPTVAMYEQLIRQEDAERSPSQPYPFFLASPLEESKFAQEDLQRYQVEWKWDGIRAQIIHRAGEVFIWSRGEDLVTEQFPELVSAFDGLPDGLVLDGEIICWEGDRPLSFNHLQKRLGRKRVTQKVMQEYPVHFIAYDCLEYDGQDIREFPLVERRNLLGGVVATADPLLISLSAVVHCASFAEVRLQREQSRQQGAEGLVIKLLDSPYLVGRKRGYWWKYKVEPMSLDAVLIYAQAGSGKRANLFTDYTFALWQGEELVPFAKAYSGLDNAEIEELDRWIRRHTLEKFGPVRAIEPVQVFEIGFEGIAQSTRHKSGISVRFPRILRWRKDKPAQEADTLQAAWHLLDTLQHYAE